MGSILKPFVLGVLVLLLAWGANILFQNKTVYDKTIGKHITQIQKVNGEITAPDKAFEKVTNENLIRWDAVHYQFIRDNHYDQTKVGDYIFAFFPLFPLIWELSGLSAIGIAVFNFLLFFSALILLFKALDISLDRKENLMKYITLLTLPGTVCFFIPYTESVFFFTMCLAFYGIMKEKYLLYFTGMMLCCMTRPAAVIIGAALVSKDIYMFITSKEYYSLPKKMVMNVLPMVIGTLIISAVQYKYDPSQFFHFYHVNKYWDHKLQMPRNLRDWSQESFSLNVASLFLLVPLMIYLLAKNVFVKTATLNKSDELFNFSIFYLLGASFFILLFQGGNLHGLFRYVLCTPFFFAFCILSFERFSKLESNQQLALFVFTFLPALFTYSFASFLAEWQFYSIGFFLVFLNFIFLFYLQPFKNVLSKIVFGLVLLFNIVWNVYMLNCYLNDGWIFT